MFSKQNQINKIMKSISSTLVVLVLLAGIAPLVRAAESTFKIGLNVAEGGDLTAPTVPTNLVATAISTSQIDLSWDASYDMFGVDGYRIFRDGAFLATTSALIYSDLGLTADTNYTYYVQAFDAAVNISASSSVATATTSANPVIPPTPTSTPTTGGSTSSGSSILPVVSNLNVAPTLVQAAVTFDTNISTQSKIYWGKTSQYELGTLSGLFYGTSHSLQITGLEADTTYFALVEVTSAAGRKGYAATSFHTQASPVNVGLSNPSNFTATPNVNVINLSWNNPTDPRFDSVRIVRSDSFFPTDQFDGTNIYEGSADSFVDKDVVVGKTYYYAIFARSKDGSFSSGAVAQGRMAKPGEVEVVGPADPFANIPDSKIVDPAIAGLTLSDFDFFQDGKALAIASDYTVALDGNKNLTVKLAYHKVPEILKTIAFTLLDPRDPTKGFSFLLRINSDKTAYEATIAPLGRSGAYSMNVVILDYANQGLKRIHGDLRVLAFANGTEAFKNIDPLSLAFLGGVALLTILVMFFRRNARDNKSVGKNAKNANNTTGENMNIGFGKPSKVNVTVAWSVILVMAFSTIFSAVTTIIAPSVAVAAINKEINYQGKLTNASNVAVTDGLYTMQFNLYTSLTGGSPVWTETLNGSNKVQVTNGLFSVMLGSTSPLTAVNFNQTLYLGVTIESDSEMSPRKILGAVPAAFVADTANTLSGLNSSQFLRSDAQNATSSGSTFVSILQSGVGKIAEFFSAAANSVLSLLSNGNVGIGSSTPGAKLAVENTLGGSTPLLSVASSTNGTGTTTALYVAANGNVGVGTTSSSSKLAVAGDAYIGGDLTATGTIRTAGDIRITGSGSIFGSGGDISQFGSIYLYNLINANLGIFNQKIGVGTSTPWANLSIEGTSTLGNQAIAGYFIATTTTASIFPYASSTALTVSGTNGLQLAASLNGPLQAINGLVSATGTMSVAYGGTGVSTAPTFGQILVGNSLGGYTLTSTSSLGIAGGSVSGGTAGMLSAWTSGSTLTATDTPTFANFWATSTTATSYLGGFLGIGSTSPMAKLTVSASPTDTNTNILLVSSSSGAVNLAYDKTGKLTLSQGSIINNYNTALAGASHTADANLIQGNFSASSGDTIFNAYGVTGIINGYTGGTHVSTLLNSAGGYFKNDIQSTDFTAASGVVIAPATVAGASGSNYYNLQAGRVTLSSGTIITSTYGLYNNGVFADTGSRNTNAYGIYSGGALVQSGGAITNNYGAYIASPQSIGSLPRSYGLYIADQSPSTVGASSSYAIYSNGGTSYFKGDIGIGSTSPFAKLSISANANDTYNPNLFLISSSTNGTATTSVLTVLANGNVGVGTSTPGTIFSIGDAGANTINISNTSTSTFATGINIKSGCFAVNGNCISGSGSGNIVDTLSATLGAGNDAGGQNIVNVGKIGVGSTSPWAQLSVEGTSTLGNQAIAGYFAATSTTATSTFAGGLYVGSTSPSLVVSSNSGKVSVGTTTDLEKLTIEGNITPSMTNTFTAGSFNLTNMTAASAAVTLSGIADNDRSGIDVASAGDVNGDGITDYMTTALWAAGGARDREVG